MDETPSCPQCEVLAGRKTPPGGILLETSGFVVHAVMAPSPLLGWVVLAARRHARWWWELDPAELAEVGPLAARVFGAQREALGAVHGYALALGDVLHHFHLHLVPRYSTTPAHLKGRGAFDPRPEDLVPAGHLASAARSLGAALSDPRHSRM